MCEREAAGHYAMCGFPGLSLDLHQAGELRFVMGMEEHVGVQLIAGIKKTGIWQWGTVS